MLARGLNTNSLMIDLSLSIYHNDLQIKGLNSMIPSVTKMFALNVLLVGTAQGHWVPRWKWGLKWSKQQLQMKKYNTERWLTAKNADCVRKFLGQWNPLWGVQLYSTMGLKPKVQPPMLIYSPFPSATTPLWIRYLKGESWWGSQSHQWDQEWTQLCLLNSVFKRSDILVAPVPPSLYTVTRNLEMKWTCCLPTWHISTWILEAAGLCMCDRVLPRIFLHPSFISQHS